MWFRRTRVFPLGLLALAALVALACNQEPAAEPQEPPESTETEAPATVEPVRPAEGECVPAEGGPDSCVVEGTHNSLIVRIKGEWVDGPSEVVVEYGNDDAGYLRTPAAPVQDGVFEAHVGRLRSETEYDFRVLPVDSAEPAATGKLTAGTLPAGLDRADIRVVEGQSSSDLTLMDFNPVEYEDEPGFTGMVALDSAGEIVWYVETGETNAIRQTPEGDIVYVDYTFGLRKITPLGEEVAALASECLPIAYHHEVEVLPDGSVLTMGFDVRDTLDDPGRLQVGDTVIRWDPRTGESEQVWSLLDFEDPATNRTDSSGLTEGFMWKGCNEQLPTEDWSHSNAVKLTPEGGFLVSSRHLNQVHSLTGDFGAVNWKLGGEGSDFAFPDPSDQFYHQHSTYQLENGNVLLFDNGNSRPEEEGGEYSRALELELDHDAGTARKVWEYVPDPEIYSPCCASVERLENGNTLMVFPGDTDTDPCCRVNTIVEAGADQETVWKVEAAAAGLNVVYRVYPADTLLGEERVEPAQVSELSG